jgi:predicted aspartyl protease
MKAPGDRVGRFFVEVELVNFRDMTASDLGALEPDKIRRVKVQSLVDSAASRLVLPSTVVKQLGLKTAGEVKVRYANGSTAKRPNVDGVYLELLGRHGLFSATVEPKRDTALIGAIVLEELDLLVDCGKRRLYPRDPDIVVSEIG